MSTAIVMVVVICIVYLCKYMEQDGEQREI